MRPLSHAAGIPVWDRFVRLFHWALVGCVVANFFIVDDGETLHQWLGYAASALVLARVVWGFVGTPYARFSNFFPTPARLRAHLVHMKQHRSAPAAGHNPLGALMMLSLMAMVLGLGTTGFLQTTDQFWGVAWLQTLHERLGQALIAFTGLHALAALVMGRLERTHLIRAMVTGVKRSY